MLSKSVRLLKVVFLLSCGTYARLRADQSGLFTYEIRDDGVAITGYPKDATGGVVIPSTIAGRPVKAIGASAFLDCGSLTSVSVPEGVTTIGPRAFENCTRLTAIPLPDSVASIGDLAFFRCSSLTDIVLPDGVTSLGWQAFRDCSSLVSISLSNSLISIPNSGFQSCSSLESISIPASVEYIGETAFLGCTSLSSVTIAGLSLPGAPRVIGWGAFQGCISVADLSIGSGVTNIGDNAFFECRALTSASIPDTVTTIGFGAFSGCRDLVTVWIGRGVTAIGLGNFTGCPSLHAIEVSPQNQAFSSLDGVLFDKTRTKLISFTSSRGGHYSIPGSVQHIPAWAFSNCASLTSISVPASVVQMGSPESSEAITRCPALTRIDVDPSNPGFSSLDGVLFNKDRSRLIRYPEGRAEDYSVPLGVTLIGDAAFRDSLLLGSVSLPESLNVIAGSAFSGCTGLDFIAIPDNLTEIGSSAFRGCTGLTSLVIPDNLTSVWHDAFSGCTALGTVSIGRGLSLIGQNAFYGCAGLNGFVVDDLNSTYRSIDGVLFARQPFGLIQYPARKAGSYTVPDGVTKLDNRAFDGCTELTSLTIQARAFGPVVPAYAGFQGCHKLSMIEVVDTLSTSRYFSRDGILFYRDVVGVPEARLHRFPPARGGTYQVPDWVSSISTNAFEGCSDLSSLLFMGDSPASPTDTGIPEFPDAAPGFTIYYFSGSTGFTSPMWRGHASVMIDPIVHPAAGWLLSHGLPFDADLQADPNGDGVSLLMAYALNLDPHRNLRASMPVPLLGPENLSLTFRAIAPGINYTAETSTDLAHWTTEGVLLSAPDADGRRTASVPRDRLERFLRLVVSE